jgi:hypothetical protein
MDDVLVRRRGLMEKWAEHLMAPAHHLQAAA